MIEKAEASSPEKRYYTAHRCSKCGRVNICRYFLAGSAAQSYDIMSRRGRKAKTDDGAVILNTSAEVFEKALSERNYAKAGVDCKCESCGHREPWTVSRRIPKLFGTLAGIGLGFAFLCCIAGFGAHNAWLYSLIPLGFAALQIAILMLILRAKKNRAKDISEFEIPITAEDPERLRELIDERWGGRD